MENMVGKKFNRWTILEVLGVENNRRYCKCQCECGTIKKVLLTEVKRGGSKSCGCLAKERHHKEANGLSKSRIYNIYCYMKSRCYNKNNARYKNYGGRGIKICDEWLNNFMNFYNWSMGNGYNDTLSIERIDVNGDYEPNNCKWITLQEQSYNKQNSRIYIVNGEKKCLQQLAIEYNITYSTLRQRVVKKGMPIMEALTKPIDTRYKRR